MLDMVEIEKVLVPIYIYQVKMLFSTLKVFKIKVLLQQLNILFVMNKKHIVKMEVYIEVIHRI